MEEENKNKGVVNHFEAGSNCQVFNGPITGCVFAMPGSTVTQHPAAVPAGPAKEEKRYERQPLSAKRKRLLNDLLALVRKGEWHMPLTDEDIKAMMLQVLNQGGELLTEADMMLSECLWSLLENRRGGDALRITWQNMIGYLDEKGSFCHHQGSPSLNKMFFGTEDGYTNIDKGRPSKGAMLPDFQSIIPLLDKYYPTPE